MKELLLVEDYCALIAFIKKIKWQVTDEKLVVCSKKNKNNNSRIKKLKKIKKKKRIKK